MFAVIASLLLLAIWIVVPGVIGFQRGQVKRSRPERPFRS